MAYNDLRDWIKTLEDHGELKRIREEISPELEITEITDRVSKSSGPALLFENVKGHPSHQVFINQFGSQRRMALALGVNSLDEIANRITALFNLKAPEGFLDKLKMLPQLSELSSAFPKTVTAKDAPCKEMIRRDHFNLNYFPILKCWPHDGGRFITLPCVVTRDPRSGKRNLGMYRMQVYDGQTTGMHWQRQKVAAEHYREAIRKAAAQNSSESPLTAGVAAMAESAGGACAFPDSPQGGLPQIALGNLKGSRLEVAVAIGTDPATTFAAIVPAPPEVEEYLIAGFLRGAPVEIVQCETVDLQVPARAEIVLEGYVELGELRAEGPFGDHTGFYSLADLYPAYHVTAITHRADPIYPTTIVGKPPMEDYFLGKATERIFLPLVQTIIPDIVDYSLPVSGVFHNCAFVKIRKECPYQARRVMHAIWGAGQMSFTKFIIVVDEDVDVHDEQDVLFHWFAHCDPQRDSEIVHGPVDILDHASPELGAGSKIGFDATAKWPAEGKVRRWPRKMEMDQTTIDLITRRWGEYGI